VTPGVRRQRGSSGSAGRGKRNRKWRSWGAAGRLGAEEELTLFLRTPSFMASADEE